MSSMHEEYWVQNPQRWRRVLVRAAGLADMYELRRPDMTWLRDKKPSYRELITFRDGMWWRSTHRRIDHKTGSGVETIDPIKECNPEFDAPTCWGCTIGLLRELDLLNVTDLRFTLGCSAGRQHYGWLLWRGFSEDFRKMIRCMSGDLAKKGLRNLVLGT